MNTDEQIFGWWRCNVIVKTGTGTIAFTSCTDVSLLCPSPFAFVPFVREKNRLLFHQFGKTPILPPAELEKIGYTIAAYPLSLLSASIKAMNSALARLQAGEPLDDLLEGFEEVQKVVGFRDYDATADKYKID